MHNFYRPPLPPFTNQTRNTADRVKHVAGKALQILRGTPVAQGSAANLISLAGTGAGTTANGSGGEVGILPYFNTTVGAVGGPALTDDLVRLSVGGKQGYIVGRRAVVGNTTVIFPLSQLDETGASTGQVIGYNGTQYAPVGGLQRIERWTADGTTGSHTFSSLAGYTDLVLEWQARGDNATTTVSIFLRFNGDSTANYDDEWVIVSGSTVNTDTPTFDAAATQMRVATIPAASATAGRSGVGRATVPNIAGTTFDKVAESTFGYSTADTTGNVVTGTAFGKWRTVGTAITSLTVRVGAGNFAAGSVASLYGLS